MIAACIISEASKLSETAWSLLWCIHGCSSVLQTSNSCVACSKRGTLIHISFCQKARSTFHRLKHHACSEHIHLVSRSQWRQVHHNQNRQCRAASQSCASFSAQTSQPSAVNSSPLSQKLSELSPELRHARRHTIEHGVI